MFKGASVFIVVFKGASVLGEVSFSVFQGDLYIVLQCSPYNDIILCASFTMTIILGLIMGKVNDIYTSK